MATRTRNADFDFEHSLLGVAQRRRADFPRYLVVSAPVKVVGAAVFVTVIVLFYLLQTSYVATSGYELDRYRFKQEDLKRQEEHNQVEIANYESLSRIETVARDQLHMVPAGHPEYLIVTPKNKTTNDAALNQDEAPKAGTVANQP